MENTLQLRAGHGEFHERWVAGMEKAIARERALVEQTRAVLDGDLDEL